MKWTALPTDSHHNFSMVVKTLFGVEQLCAEELKVLGAENIEVQNRAVSFDGNLGVMYKANLLLRTGLRILIPFATFKADNEHALYDQIKAIAWEDFFSNKDTIAIDSLLKTDFFRHSQYVSQKTKDAIVDRFRERTGERPSVDLENPTVRLHIHISGDDCELALDSSGDSLHKRGYRDKTNLAPINEVLAAALVKLTGWDERSTFVDGMCGSGTILIEAAMAAANIPAGYHIEEFGFMRWKQVLPFDKPLWDKIWESAIERISSENIALYGIEISPNVARKAKANILASKTEDMIKVRIADFTTTDPPAASGKPILILNPPYGERMDKDNVEELYKQIGDTFKQRYKGYECWIISSNMEALKHIGLKPDRRIPMFNGALECRFVKFTIYDGTKRTKFKES
jgi:putative N6-adenine-specific DNA methylase